MAQDRKVTVKHVGGTVNGKPITQPARQTENAAKEFGTKK